MNESSVKPARRHSVVLESKIVEPKDPAVCQYVKVKDGGRFFLGNVMAIGNKTEIEIRMNEIKNVASEDSDQVGPSVVDTNVAKGELPHYCRVH